MWPAKRARKIGWVCRPFVPGVAGTWKELTVNVMAANLNRLGAKWRRWRGRKVLVVDDEPRNIFSSTKRPRSKDPQAVFCFWELFVQPHPK